MLALSFLLMIGCPVAEGLDQHIPKGYIYLRGLSVCRDTYPARKKTEKRLSCMPYHKAGERYFPKLIHTR